MEQIVAIVGFLGAGKTTLLKRLTQNFLENEWKPFVILNDYQNAHLDSQQFLEYLDSSQLKALSGSCICCSGVTELREQVNSVPKRDKGVTLIEANGTTDACTLMGFLGVGLKDQFLPPIQVSVVDVRNWQKRGYHNELESNQVQVSSLVVLNYADKVDRERLAKVKNDILSFNPMAKLQLWNELSIDDLVGLTPSSNKPQKMDHAKAHWSSCSADLPDPMPAKNLRYVLDSLPKDILRLKGCTKIDQDEHYSYFEKTPEGEVNFRPYKGTLITGPKLLIVGPGSDPSVLNTLIQESSSL